MLLLENQVGSLRSKKTNKFAKFRENRNAWSHRIGFAPTSKFALILDWVSMLPNQAAAMQAMSQCTGAPRTWRCTCGMSKWLPRKNLLSWSELLLHFYLSECLYLSILQYLCANCFALRQMFKQQHRAKISCEVLHFAWAAALSERQWTVQLDPLGSLHGLKSTENHGQRDMTPMVWWYGV